MEQPKYSFVRADLDTSQRQVTALWAQGLVRLVDEVADEKYRHYYLDNPAGRGDCLFLIDNASGDPVGVQGYVPRRYWFNGRPFEAAALADFVVVPEHRSLGPALKLMRAGIELGKSRFAFFYGTPNDKSAAIVRRAGIETIGKLTRYTKVIRSESYWRRRIPSWLVRPVAALADLAVIGVDLGHTRLRGQPFTWREHTEFGPEFEAIWALRRPDRLYGERSRTTLAWRYAAGGRNGSRQISLATDRRGEPVGYLVWHVHQKAAIVSDFLFPSADDAALGIFLRSFAWHVRRYAVDRVSLEFFGAQGIVDALGRSGFAAREQSPIVHVDHSAGAAPMTAATAYFTSFDRDHQE